MEDSLALFDIREYIVNGGDGYEFIEMDKSDEVEDTPSLIMDFLDDEKNIDGGSDLIEDLTDDKDKDKSDLIEDLTDDKDKDRDKDRDKSDLIEDLTDDRDKSGLIEDLVIGGDDIDDYNIDEIESDLLHKVSPEIHRVLGSSDTIDLLSYIQNIPTI